MHPSQQSADQPKGLQNKVLSEGRQYGKCSTWNHCLFFPPLRVRSKANRGGSPPQYYLRAQTVDLERQSGTAGSLCLSTLITVFVITCGGREGGSGGRSGIVCAPVVIVVHFPSNGGKYSETWASNWEKRQVERFVISYVRRATLVVASRGKYDMLHAEPVAHFETRWITLLGSGLNYVCAVQSWAL